LLDSTVVASRTTRHSRINSLNFILAIQSENFSGIKTTALKRCDAV